MKHLRSSLTYKLYTQSSSPYNRLLTQEFFFQDGYQSGIQQNVLEPLSTEYWYMLFKVLLLHLSDAKQLSL